MSPTRVLGPLDVCFVNAQGFATGMALASQVGRTMGKMVEDKRKLEVTRLAFLNGSNEPGVIPGFSAKDQELMADAFKIGQDIQKDEDDVAVTAMHAGQYVAPMEA